MATLTVTTTDGILYEDIDLPAVPQEGDRFRLEAEGSDRKVESVLYQIGSGGEARGVFVALSGPVAPYRDKAQLLHDAERSLSAFSDGWDRDGGGARG